MKIYILLAVAFFCHLPNLALAHSSNAERLLRISKLERLAFGSCNKHKKNQPIWNEIARQSPDVFVWAGDIVYADGKGVAEIETAYNHQNSVESYKNFKAITPIIGVWDDHDYGKNNGGYEYEFRQQSQHFLMNFLEEPLDSKRRLQEGIYTSYTFGQLDQKIKIILLDNRYFKNLNKGGLLGDGQWKWLEREVKTSDASLHLVVSGISILSPKTIHSEEWADYPDEKVRLRNILRSVNTPYLYLAGDKHFSDIFSKGDELEFLSSGMTHNTEWVVRPIVRRMYPSPVFQHNFSMIDFDWDNKTPVLSLAIKTENGKTYNAKKIKWVNGRWLEI